MMRYEIRKIDHSRWLFAIPDSDFSQVDDLADALTLLFLNTDSVACVLKLPQGDDSAMAFKLMISLLNEARLHPWDSEPCLYRRRAIELLFPKFIGWNHKQYRDYLLNKIGYKYKIIGGSSEFLIREYQGYSLRQIDQEMENKTISPEDVAYCLELPQKNNLKEKITQLISSLLLAHAHNDWDSDICLFHREAIGLLEPALSKGALIDYHQYVIDSINDAVEHQTPINFSDYPPLFIVLYYGENYDQSDYSPRRRALDAQSPPADLYSRTVYKTTNIKMGDRVYTPQELAQLNAAAGAQQTWFRFLDGYKFTPSSHGYWESSTGRTYSSLADMHHQRAVGAYASFKEEAKEVYQWASRTFAGVPMGSQRYAWLNQRWPQVLQTITRIRGHKKQTKHLMYVGFESAGDPYIPTSSRASVAIKYAMNDGIVAWENPLSDTAANGPWAKVYIFIFSLEEYKKLLASGDIISTFLQVSYAQEHHNSARRLPEDEYTFRTKIAAANIAEKVVITTGDRTPTVEARVAQLVATSVRARGGFPVYLLPDGKLTRFLPGDAGVANVTPISQLCSEVATQKSTPENSPAKIAVRRRQAYLTAESQRAQSTPRQQFSSPQVTRIGLFSHRPVMQPRRLDFNLERELEGMLTQWRALSFDENSERRNFGLEQYSIKYAIGNCLFEAIATQTPDFSGEDLRAKAVAHIRQDEELQGLINTLTGQGNALRTKEGEKPYTDAMVYTDLMARDQTWGTQIELLALARVLQRPIVVLTPGNVYDQIIEESSYADNEPIFLTYINSNHYEPMRAVSANESTQLILQRIRDRIAQLSIARSGGDEFNMRARP